jgi:hypothetical protein
LQIFTTSSIGTRPLLPARRIFFCGLDRPWTSNATSWPDLARVPVDRLDTPAGLDIGARTAAEIALSILAKVVSARARSIQSVAADPQPDPVTSVTRPPAGVLREPGRIS